MLATMHQTPNNGHACREMAVPRLSTWDLRRQICFMRGRSMGSSRDNEGGQLYLLQLCSWPTCVRVRKIVCSRSACVHFGGRCIMATANRPQHSHFRSTAAELSEHQFVDDAILCYASYCSWLDIVCKRQRQRKEPEGNGRVT
jgi:hypothetical protein